jgi:primosomal protein N' (replication factor Y) (superfamily II helicase)
MHILNVALAVPLRRCFDYAVDKSIPLKSLLPGMRVLVPFGKNTEKVGMLLGISDQTSVPANKLKKISSVIDQQAVLSASELKLLKWTSDYYHHPIGEVIFNTLPAFLKHGKPAELKVDYCWHLSEMGNSLDPVSLKRAPKQLALFNILVQHPNGLSIAELETQLPNSRAILNTLYKKGLVEKRENIFQPIAGHAQKNIINLNVEQKQAIESVTQSLGKKSVFLLDGVTGSGKTEVYIEIMRAVLDAGKQVVILSPEIGLAPQLHQRITSSLPGKIALMHSGISDGERLQAWMEAKNGIANIIIGTRSAIWVPLMNPGLFIVDEEHDLSYKQQDGLRYSARDVAIMRGKLSNSPVLLGSATPSAESLRNIEMQKFDLLTLNKRAGEAKTPTIKIIDLRNRAMQGAVSQVLLSAIEKELSQKNQTMLFLNRRGYSPTIMCHHCGWIADCTRCDLHMTYHKQKGVLSCHHCDSQKTLPAFCPDCSGDQLIELGHGTERLTETLTQCFPKARILRIDRDSTRRKGSMEDMINSVNAGEADILIGTQMLAKGHHFPKLSLVGIIDTDGGLCSTDFRASERLAQLFIQVSGRAGRAQIAGEVMIQTHFPEHPLLNSLINGGYRQFAQALLREREQANLPPFSYLALLRAESHLASVPREFLQRAKVILNSLNPQMEVYGPIPAPIERRAGKTRMQLLVVTNGRGSLKQSMQSWMLALEKLPAGKKVRWSLDIDPQELM